MFVEQQPDVPSLISDMPHFMVYVPFLSLGACGVADKLTRDWICAINVTSRYNVIRVLFNFSRLKYSSHPTQRSSSSSEPDVQLETVVQRDTPN